MTKKRKLHELIGTINHAYLGYSKSKTWKKQPFYLLVIQSESLFMDPSEINLYAFSNLVTPTLWTTLEQRNYEQKKYLFWCEKRVRGWRLRSWEELAND